MFGKKKNSIINTKKRYRGKRIHRVKDRIGLIEVVDNDWERSLYFGTKEKQSSMDLNLHYSLVLSYTRAMMAGLLFLKKPKVILNVGLGGGSIPKFLKYHFPDCRIDIVEIREEVVKIAHDYFYLPEGPSLNIFIADIKDYFRYRRSTSYDLIILDVFDQNGMSESARGFTFLNTCQSRLCDNGVIIMNLWSEPKEEFRRMTDSLFRCFKNQVMILPVSDRSNQIGIGIKRSGGKIPEPYFRKRSEKLEVNFNIGLPALFSDLYSENTRVFA